MPRDADDRFVPHLSELHGAATHLAVIAIPVYAVVLMLRRFGPDHQTLRHVEPWLLGAALAGVALAGVTGLLVWGQSKTMLRGSHYDIGGIHFWLGIALAVVLVGAAAIRLLTLRRGGPTHGPVLLAAGAIALVAVFVQGYLGGRMTWSRRLDGPRTRDRPGDRGQGRVLRAGPGLRQLPPRPGRGPARAEPGRGPRPRRLPPRPRARPFPRVRRLRRGLPGHRRVAEDTPAPRRRRVVLAPTTAP
ncbi:MAG: DUF2231 domain-containing protein [Solirubrobacteraceae bacterium]